MKLKIHKKSKKILILIFCLLLIFSSIQIFLPMASPNTVINEKTQYEAACQPNVNYQVVLNPNEVYTGTTQNEGEYYSKKLLNHIQTDFELKYVGSKEVPLDIEYQMIATVIGYQGKEQKEETTYWKKSFPITNKKIIKEESTSTWSKSERVNVPLGGYDAFAVRAKEITGMDISNQLTVSMTGKITAHTGKDNLETPFDVKIQIPLMEDVFQITKAGTDQIKDTVKIKVEAPKPVDLFHTVLYGTLFILCLIGLIILIFFTREPNQEEMLLKKVNNIIKNYGSRIIALQNIPKVDYKQYYKVHSIKDLIKIADEIQKPIFYETDKDVIVKNFEFHVIENDTIYSLIINSAEA